MNVYANTLSTGSLLFRKNSVEKEACTFVELYILKRTLRSLYTFGISSVSKGIENPLFIL